MNQITLEDIFIAQVLILAEQLNGSEAQAIEKIYARRDVVLQTLSEIKRSN